MRASLFVAAAALGAARGGQPGADIPRVRLSKLSTVSGISSGAFMAVQMHVSFSDTINGVGALAGGPFWCAQADLAIALTECESQGELIIPLELAAVLETTALTGFVAPLANIKNSRMWALSARNDSVVAKSVVEANVQLYELVGLPSAAVEAVYDVIGEHSQLTTDYGNDCTYLGEPYINNCGYDAAGAALQWLFQGNLTPPSGAVRLPGPVRAGDSAVAGRTEVAARVAASRVDTPLRLGSGSVYSFDQGLFIGGSVWSDVFGLGETGYIYIPDACLLNQSAAAASASTATGDSGTEGPAALCRLHVAFHGCKQSLDDIGTDFVLHSGHIPWAEANNFVVLYPQAVTNALNPEACWDWWGYTGTAYASNVGVQTSVVKHIMDSLIDGPSYAAGAGVRPAYRRLLTPEGAAEWAASPMGRATVGRSPVVAAP